MATYKAVKIGSAGRQVHLDSLRSVSAAFKATVKEEPLYVPRQRTAEAPRNPPQASNPQGDGGDYCLSLQQVYGSSYSPDIFFTRAATLAYWAGGKAAVGPPSTHLKTIGDGQLTNGQGRMAAIQMAAAQYAPSVPTPKPQPKNIQAGEIVAWRAWRTRSDNRLHSLTSGAVWQPRVTMNDMQGAGSGGVRGGHGIFAYKTKDDVEREFAGSLDFYAIGEVELWGEVIECEIGYRAQYASVRSIESVGRYAGNIKKLRQLYVDESPAEPPFPEGVKLLLAILGAAAMVLLLTSVP